MRILVAIPFRVGWGFQRLRAWMIYWRKSTSSQSLSGWGGVFNLLGNGFWSSQDQICRNPFQGGVGFSTSLELEPREDVVFVAIPFRLGWGFQRPTEEAADIIAS